MKQLAILVCLLLGAGMTIQAKGIREDIDFTGDKARTSYAFGMAVGGDLQQSGLELDYTAFTEGLRAAMEGRQTIMDRDEALEIVQNAFEYAMRRQYIELQEQEEAFLAQNAAEPGVQSTPSGLQYVVIQAGNGSKPETTDTVRVHYEGALINGEIFDSSYERDEPEEIPLDMVIPGWAEGILLMEVGSTHRLYIPSNLAYGERGAGQVIPPFSTLIFTVELLAIVNDTDESADLSGDSDSEN